jgi:CRP-like cAMP-binding protein
MSDQPGSRVRSHSCDSCALHKSFCSFPEEVQAAFDALKTTVAFWKGETIFHEGDRCENVYAICEGTVKVVATSSEGRVLLLRFGQAGSMLGLAEAVLGPVPFECSAIAAENTILSVIPRDLFMRFIRSYPEAALSLVVALSEQYKVAQRETKLLGFGDPSSVRLAHLLLEWSANQGMPCAEGILIPLQVTHGELAQAIGATRETVTRLLGNLMQSGLLARTAAGIIIRRPERLAGFGARPLPDSDDAGAFAAGEANAPGQGRTTDGEEES